MNDQADPAMPAFVPLPERSFYEQEFAGSAIVVSLAEPDRGVVDEVGRVATSLARVGAPLVLVVGTGSPDGASRLVELLTAVVGRPPAVLAGVGSSALDVDRLADLWLAVHASPSVVVPVPAGQEAVVAADLATAVRAIKVVFTDPAGGWGDPPRSFADVTEPASGYREGLADRQGGLLVPSVERALAGGVVNANLCRARDLDRELFTFDGTGTLFTRGGYLRLDRLRVDDLPAVEALFDQGVQAGVLKPRSRHEVARLAVTGLGARVNGGDHLAGVVSLEREPYRAESVGEVVSLYAVSRFSAAGAGGLLVDGLLAQAAEEGLRAVFAVTVSDLAAAFFTRKGFVEVGPDEVPAAKWVDYDPERRAVARIFLRPVGDGF
ncbi:MAG: GNAT family N-acetyltransferase [Actinobacteria bacterium]|nr:GNAT family N-acetyltransferase [Actinomycetota bacterium]